ncbi:uncharacterized protein LOC144744123 [Ciona intestinalis]
MNSNVTPNTAKLHLANSSQVNVSDITTVVNQILKGSNSAVILGKSQQNLVTSETNINNSVQTFHKFSALVTHLNYQQEAITKSIKQTELVTAQLDMVQWSRTAVLHLYRTLLQRSHTLKYTDKNHYKGVIRAEFEKYKTLTDQKEKQHQLDKGNFYLKNERGELV